jgi:hypothetical protein
LWTFFAIAKPKANADRRLVFLNLQGMNQATKTFQQISRRDIQDPYPVIANVAPAAWGRVQLELEEGLDPRRRPLEVPLVVLTATRQALQSLTPERRAWLQADFGLSEAQLLASHGDTREQWQPFAGTDSIAVLLEQLRSDVNTVVGNYTIRWHQPGESFWTDIAAASDFVKKEFKTGEFAVVVIDPVAMYDPDVYQRLMLFHDSLTSEKITLFTLPPFAASQGLVGLRKALMNRVMPYFDDFFQPQVPPLRKLVAQCGWNVMDREDVRRLIVAAAGRLVTQTGTATASPFVRQG